MKQVFDKGSIRNLIYENDFSSHECMDKLKVVYGQMELHNGMLRALKNNTEGRTVALLDICDCPSFTLEADFVNHQKGGGIFFGGNAAAFLASSEEVDRSNGYYAFIESDGTTAGLGCTHHFGAWSGNFTTSHSGRLKKGTDIHFYLRVSGDYIVYILTDKSNGEEVFRAEYKKGDSFYDIHPYDTGCIAFCIENDGGIGGFTNIRLFNTKKAIETEEVLKISQKLKGTINATECEEFIVLENKGQGYAFSYDGTVERIMAYRYINGNVYYLAHHAMQLVIGNKYPFSIVNEKNVIELYLGDHRYPVLTIRASEQTEYKICSSAGMYADIEDAVLYKGPVYQNPVTYGADPEILYHDGIFYLYTLDQTSGSCRVRVRTSENLYEWAESGFAFELVENSPIAYFMSPNVFYKNGYFYLLIASQLKGCSDATDFHVFYASSRSPLGPFAMNMEKPYINTEAEIGGAPFIDDDGRVYITTVRFGGGNHIYIQELNAVDGVLSTQREAVHCLSPTEYYEIDEYGPISEGGVIVKHKGYYYMLYASGHFRGHYGESYAISKNIYGPYTKYQYNEVLSSNRYVDGVGDCMIVVCPELEENYVVYHKHADRGNKGYDRDICIDRFYFVPAEDGGPDVLRIYGPTSTPVPVPQFKKSIE